jgi:site-specific DNA-methyltransferase (adenine-specific)
MRDDGSSGFLPGFADAGLGFADAGLGFADAGLGFADAGRGAALDGAVFHANSSRSVTECSPVPGKQASNGPSRTQTQALFSSPSAANSAASVVASYPTTTTPFSLHRGDAVEWLRTLAPGSIDLLITDPPYESLEKHRAVGTTTRLKHSKSSSNDWFQIFPNSRFEELFTEVYRVLARNSHFYLFCDPETMFIAKPIAERCGFRFWKPLVWDKQKIGMGYHYRARYEFVLFFEKGKRKLNDLGIPDVIECARIRNGYPTEKPVYVSEVLIRQSSEPGELVVDPFMGSASVGAAALSQQRRFMGCDVSDNALAISETRLSDLTAAYQNT